MRRALAALALVASACSRGAAAPASAAAADRALDHELVGTTPPEWTVTNWLHPADGADGSPGGGTTLAALRGRVVLVRWFMSTSCPYCSATAPSLRRLHADYAARGLVVVGLYHHKERRPLAPGEYEGYAAAYGFDFPVARDAEWTTLRRWWLTRDRDFTSVSFLIDRAGRIRGVHPGGSYAPEEAAYGAIRRGVERLLDEP